MATSKRATQKFSGPLVVGVELDVKDLSSGKWYQAEVIKSEFFKIEIKYRNFPSQYNTEWISTEKDLHRIEPVGTCTTVKVEEISDNKSKKSDNNSDAKTEVFTDYFDESTSSENNDKENVIIVNNSKKKEIKTKSASKAKSKSKSKTNESDSKANEVISLLESKVQTLEFKLQTALNNDVVLNSKVNKLTKENEALKLKASRMSNEIKTLKKMLNELKSDELEAWEEVE